MLFKIIAVFVFFRFFILYLAFKLYTDKVKISELREGMAPAEGIFKKGDSFEKEEFLQSCFTGYFSQKTRKFIHGQESLSEEDVEKIKALEKQGKFKFDSLLVHQAQPFALFIFAGFLLTLLCAGSVVTFLRLAI
ncbi:MAG: hypothetical protein NT067_05460 [Candidatus Diapherotrites archaeon]|nr:hypothetical protein [Candidatus Diapherotrites archaeon]